MEAVPKRVGQRHRRDAGSGRRQISCASSAGKSEQPQYVFGDSIGGRGVVPLGFVLQQLAESEESAGSHCHRQFGIVDRESSCRRRQP